MKLRNPLAIVALAIVLLFSAHSSFAQNRNFGARTFSMDDGLGHIFTMIAPTGMLGNINYQFPLPPTGSTPGFVNAGTAGGQTLFWNTAPGPLQNSWVASNVITNNVNGNNSNVAITSALSVTGATTLSGATQINNTVGVTGLSTTAGITNVGAISQTGTTDFVGVTTQTGHFQLKGPSSPLKVFEGNPGALNNLLTSAGAGNTPTWNSSVILTNGSFSGNLGVTGSATLDSVYANKFQGGSANFSGTLGVTGVTTVDSIFANKYGGGVGNFSTINATTINTTNLNVTNQTFPSLTPGSVTFIGSTNTLSQNNANLFWDDNNTLLMVGTNSAVSQNGRIFASGDDNSTFDAHQIIASSGDNTSMLELGYNTANGYGAIQSIVQGQGGNDLRLQPAGGNVGIGYGGGGDGGPVLTHALLDVNGTLNVQLAVNFRNLTTGVVHSDVNGLLSSSPVDLTSDVSISILPIANGGTGTSSVASNNQIFAGPVVGPGAPGFRTLVTSDLPDLSGSYLPLTGGTMSGAINMGANGISNLTTPTQNTDAATKGYVDAGDGMNAASILSETARATAAENGKLSLSGGSMTGSIDMGNNSITNANLITATTFTGALTGNATNITGTLAIANGGTGQTTAGAAITALLPAQSVATTNQVLTSDGTFASWQPGGFVPAILYATVRISSVVVAAGAAIPAFASISYGFTPGVGSFTVGAAGIYNVEFTVEVATAGSVPLALQVNGVVSLSNIFEFKSGAVTHYNVILPLSAGDVISLINNSGGAVTLTTSQTSPAQFSMTRIQ